MTTRQLLSLVMCGLVFFSMGARAEVTTVSDLVKLGLTRSLEREAKVSDTQALKSVAARSRLSENPIVSLEVANREKQGGSARQLRAAVTQPLGLGRFSALGEVADLNTKVGEFELQSLSLGLQSQLYRDIYRFLAADEKTQHAEERVSRFREIKNFLGSRSFASPQKKAEAMIVAGKIQILQKEFLHLRAERDGLWESINTYLGLTDRPKIKTGWFRGEKTIEFGPLWETVRAVSPQLKIRETLVERATAEGVVAHREKWRGAAVSGYYSGETGFDTEKIYGVGLALPLPVFDTGATAVKVAELEKNSATNRAAFELRKIEAELRSAVLRYGSAREAVLALPIASIRGLETTMRTTDQGFRKGQVDLLTYIEAENQHSDGLAVIFDAQAEYAQELAILSSMTADLSLLEEK